MRIKIALICLAFLPVLAGNQGMTPQDVARLKSVGDAMLSPNGETIAYTLNVPRVLFEEENGSGWVELHVWNKSHGSRGYVTGKVKVSHVRWSPDGKSISFLSKRGDDAFDSLYKVPLHGGEAQQVLTHETSIKSYEWSGPNGIVFIAGEKEDEKYEKLEDKGFNQEIYEEELINDRVWVADLSGDSVSKRKLDLMGSAVDISVSTDGTRIAVALAPSPLVDDKYMYKRVHIVEAADAKLVRKVENPGKLGAMRWSPDDKHLAMISAADIHDPSAGRLFVADMSDGLDKYFLEDKGDVTKIAWRDAQTIHYLWDEGVETTVKSLQLGQKPKDALQSDIPSMPGLSYASKRVALVGDTPSHPHELFLWDDGKASATRLTNSNPWLDEVKLAPQEVVNYKARDGVALQGLLIRPLDEEKGKRYPLILGIHGGPESHYRNGWLTGYSLLGQVAAARGFAVFYPNYRASTGRGVTFSKMDHGRPAMEEFDDIVDAVTHLTKMGLVDDKKVGVTGGSYGGYATAWCATALTEHFAAGVMFVGISDKISKLGTSDIPDEVFLVHDRHRLWDEWDLFLKQSPIYHVKKANTPLLIMHGKDDPRVPPSQSLELFRHLKTLGKVPVRLVFYPGEGHGNKKAAARYDYSLRSMRWFEHYLQGPGGEKPDKDLDYGEKIDSED